MNINHFSYSLQKDETRTVALPCYFNFRCTVSEENDEVQE